MILVIAFESDLDVEVLEKINSNQIKSIVYIEKRVSFSEWDGKFELQKKIYYSHPDKVRIEKLDDLHEVEIINRYNYVYYNDRLDKIIVRQTIPKIELDIFDAFSMPYDSKTEFQGYETKGNITYNIFSFICNIDDTKYVKKIWTFEHEGISLPYKIEYFINNSIVSLSTFEYVSINKPIDDNLFRVDSLPQKNFAYDGCESAYFLNIEDALKYISFIPKISISGDYSLIKIEIIRIQEENVLRLNYNKDDVNIILNEKKANKNFKGYTVKSEGENIIINFIEDGVEIEISGKAEDYVDIMQFCSSITQKINFEAIDGEYYDE
ncbi:hypothetical protein ABG79_00649 [Caloramator mitchellensis]|uniref:Uncharacterized protein n=1 Tax=Caloramator mitchellensis TaxID=908809 RepID=A0A0R3K4N2_CALMK|nr:hypothetical protein ABG79_00649 [Caloramator mitchellensis]